MPKNKIKYLKVSVKLTSLAVLASTLSGCLFAMPPAMQAASLALDGISYVSTGKSVGDHALSAVAHKDCAVLRALNNQPICEDDKQLGDLEAVDKTLAQPKSEIVKASENLGSIAAPRWRPYTPQQRHLAEANTIDRVIMMSRNDDTPL